MNWNAVAALAAVGAALATAVGVWATVWMILLAGRQTRTEWEDDLTREYRRIAQNLPLWIRLGEPGQDKDIDEHLDVFLNYFDLSNQQALLRKTGRVSRKTWKEWRIGIQDALKSGAYAMAWAKIQRRSPNLYEELKALGEVERGKDPDGWKRLPLL